MFDRVRGISVYLLILINKIVLIQSGHLASLVTECNLPTWGPLLRLVRPIARVWSAYIVVGHTWKLIIGIERLETYSSPLDDHRESDSHKSNIDELPPIDWLQFLLTDYLPLMPKAYAFIYHGFIITYAATAVCWRISVGRRRTRLQQFQAKWHNDASQIEPLTLDNIGRDSPLGGELNSSPLIHPPVDPLLETVYFALRDPDERRHDDELVDRFYTEIYELATGVGHKVEPHVDDVGGPSAPSSCCKQRRPRVQGRLMARQWSRHYGESEASNLTDVKFYRNTIGITDLWPRHSSAHRWHYNIWNLYLYTLLRLSMQGVQLYYLFRALYVFIDRFGIKRKASHQLVVEGELLTQAQMIDYMEIYCYIQQAFLTLDAGGLLAGLDVYLTLTWCDISYRAVLILEELSSLLDQLEAGQLTTLPLKSVYRLQRLICAYFNHIERVNEFLGLFAVHVVGLIAAILLFGQRILWIRDADLFQAVVMMLAFVVVEFLLLNIISYRIERRGEQMSKYIHKILARDRAPENAMEWQRILGAFYSKNYLRTYTIFKRFPLNFGTMVRFLIFTFVLSCLVFRVFYLEEYALDSVGRGAFKLNPLRLGNPADKV